MNRLTHILILATCGIAFSQLAVTGSIVGPDGAPVAGCIVSLVNDSVYAETDNSGAYELTPSGAVSVRDYRQPMPGHNGNRLCFQAGAEETVRIAVRDVNGRVAAVSDQQNLTRGRYSFSPSALLPAPRM